MFLGRPQKIINFFTTPHPHPLRPNLLRNVVMRSEKSAVIISECISLFRKICVNMINYCLIVTCVLVGLFLTAMKF